MAMTMDSGAPLPRVPLSVFDAGLPSTGEFCATLVAAECDGSEDCGEGQVCCGTFEAGRYTEIKCAASCGVAREGYALCHPGETCPAPVGTDAGAENAPVCRRSTVLPSYMAVCLAPSSTMLVGFTGLPAAEDAINCGADNACSGGEQCCVLANWDATTRAITQRSGYCAPQGASCSCADAPDTDGGV